MKAVDLFAGPRGWGVAARALEIDEVGIEIDPAPAATARAAGFEVVEGDVAALDPTTFGRPELLIGSPPCPDFSKSNRRNALGLAGVRGALVLEPLRWIEALEPRLVALEQVPDVLPIWQEYEIRLEALGYRTWSGLVNAANFGAPQTRKRAIFTARLDDGLLVPLTTHTENPTGETFLPIEDRLPWVTMAEALADLGPYHVRLEEGAPYVETDLPAWAHERPSTTVTSGGRVAAPGYRQHDERQFGKGAVRLTPEQAARLQTFPDGYPWRPPRVHQQIGNAVPPRLARAILEALTGRTRT